MYKSDVAYNWIFNCIFFNFFAQVAQKYLVKFIIAEAGHMESMSLKDFSKIGY